MPAYHSTFGAGSQVLALTTLTTLTSSPQVVGNMAITPIKTTSRGPAPCLPPSEEADIIDEALYYFKANVFFRTYEIKSEADRVLIYLTLYITECLKKLQKCSSKAQGLQDMYSLAIARFDIPGASSLQGMPVSPPPAGDPGFPLNGMYLRPASPEVADLMRQYFLQVPTGRASMTPSPPAASRDRPAPLREGVRDAGRATEQVVDLLCQEAVHGEVPERAGGELILQLLQHLLTNHR